MVPPVIRFFPTGRGPTGREREADLHLSLEGFERTYDSWAFAHSDRLDRSPEQLRPDLIRLLEGWIDGLRRLGPTAPVYLPFEWDDQYAACLKCAWAEEPGEILEVTPGSFEPGGTWWPVLVPGYLLELPNFSPGLCGDSAPFSAPFLVLKEDLLQGIRAAIAELAEEQTCETAGNPLALVSLDPAWQTATVLSLARAMSAAGDLSAMPILADALEDAGCDSAALLDHCRRPGPHLRGCWVVDLVLGKE